MPRAVLYQVVLTEMPAKAEPLLFAADVNAYSTSEKPCEPVLSMLARSCGKAIAAAAPISTNVGVVSR